MERACCALLTSVRLQSIQAPVHAASHGRLRDCQLLRTTFHYDTPRRLGGVRRPRVIVHTLCSLMSTLCVNHMQKERVASRL